MRQILQMCVLLFVFSTLGVAQEKTGSLSVFVFKDQTPLHGSVVTVDGKKIFKSDRDGSLSLTLPVGKHTIEVIGRGTDKINLGYYKKMIVIKEGRDTQVISTFSRASKTPLVTVDTPVGTLTKAKSKQALKVTGKGRLNGVVLSSEGKTPISGARVFVKGTTVDARTDENGQFSVEVPSGVALSISVVHTAYSAQTISGVKVSKNSTTSRRITLTPASMELEEYVVLAPKVEGSLTDIISEEKNSNAVASILGSAEISKKGDSNAAAALRRVTGVTLVDGKSIYVRGLGERYSNVEMNGLPLPSPNPLRRSVPLDIFPASVIGSMKVQKSASADIPSSFGGGYIDIRTKENFDEDFIKVTLAGYLNSYTGSAQNDYVGSATDWTGYDHSFRPIPQTILDAAQIQVGERIPSFNERYFTPAQLETMTRLSGNRIYQVSKSPLKPGFGGSIEGAKSFDLNDDHHLTVYGTYTYRQENLYTPEEYYGYSDDGKGNQNPVPLTSGTIERTDMKVSHGGMFNIGYNYMNVLRLKYTKLYTKNSIKSTRVTAGTMGSDIDYNTYYNLNWEERELIADQLSGDFDYQIFNLESNFRFGLEYSTANFYQPNNYQYYYYTPEGGGAPYLDSQLNNISTTVVSDDTLMAATFANRHNISLFNENEFIEYGISLSSKKRVSRQYRFQLSKDSGASFVEDQYLVMPIDTFYNMFVLPAYPYEYMPYKLDYFPQPGDHYDGYVDEQSPYLSWKSRPRDDVEMVLGVRYVNLEQRVDEYFQDEANGKRTAIQSRSLNINEYFPSMSLKYKYNEKQYFDFAASKTYIMPDIREFTSGTYSHPFDVADIRGNPNLVNTIIYNMDFKYSYFLSESETVRFGLFYKYMENPIEDILLPSTSLPVYSYANAESATLYGIEIDGRKNLDFMSSFFNHCYVAGNFSYNYSDVTLTAEQKDIFSSSKRGLQGLSPYVVNVTVGYDKPSRSVLLTLNKMSERIRKIGLLDDTFPQPDQYEIPPTLLDFIWMEKFNYGYDFEVKTKIGNILDSATVWKQGDGVTRRFKRGQNLSVKISAKF